MQPLRTPPQVIEFFQVRFLSELSRMLPASSYAVKGGCNLRLMLGSPRSSEDMDLDIRQVARHTLEKNVTHVLERQVARLLVPGAVQIIEFSAPKQTDTVQRWKVTLSALGQKIHTKVEFSRREFSSSPEASAISVPFSERYDCRPFLVPHYTMAGAFSQKIGALAARNISQARDVFDLEFLHELGARCPRLDQNMVAKAQLNLIALTYEDYAAKVIPYLDEEAMSKFAGREAWDRMQQSVLALLEGKEGDNRQCPGLGMPLSPPLGSVSASNKEKRGEK